MAIEKDAAKDISINFKGKRQKNKDQLISAKRASKGRKSSFTLIEKCIFTRNKKGFGFVAIGKGRSDVFIGQKEQGFAMEGDLVEIEIFNKRGFRGKRKGTFIRVLERASREILARLKRTRQKTVAIPVNLYSGLPFLWIAKEDDSSEIESGTLI